MTVISSALTQLKDQRVIVRCNFDVPLKHGQVEDTTRLDDALPTLRLLYQLQARPLILAHAGRPEGKYDPQLSLAPVAAYLSSKLPEPVTFVPYGPVYSQLAFAQKPFLLLDNLRFYPQEEAADPDFAQFFASQATAYVNEAFANCHRTHASMVTLPALLKPSAYVGLSLASELEVLHRVTTQPQRPLVVVIGGAKLETKEPLVTALAPRADTVLVGGKIAADLSPSTSLPPNVKLAQLTPDGLDITPGSAQEFADIIAAAGTVIWNGTLGQFETETARQGTTLIAQAMDQTPAFTLVGGGDTEAALTQLNLEAGIDHISTGGGAMLEFLSSGHLVAVDALA